MFIFVIFYFNWLKKQVKHHYIDELSTKLQYIEKILKIRFNEDFFWNWAEKNFRVGMKN